jgi:malate synthase
MTNYTESHKLSIARELKDFVAQEILPGLDIAEDHFWDSLSNIFYEYKDENKAFLETRESIQTQIDEWHKKNKDFSADDYKLFLKSIGYLKDEGPDFSISTSDVDDEVAVIAGPQLVVPVMNARFALNAANARWGSLYDALYGTDMISEADGAERSGPYNPVRGDKVIAFAKQFLDQYFSLDKGSFTDVVGFDIDSQGLSFKLNSNELTKLDQTDQFIGYQGSSSSPTSILLKNNNLHVEIQIDKDHSVGANDPAGIKDVYLESAITTIQDCEDSVAAVDAQDKIQVYRNWLGLMKGDLKESFQKGGKEITRTLNPDRSYFDVQGNEFSLPGRSTMLVRNVGHLMTNPAILDKDGNEIPEGIMDAMFTICIAKHDLIKNSNFSNSRAGSIYIVKPKMHGPEEVAFACRIFEAVEQALMLKPLTVKIGIMDEERRTTVNLKECIRSAQDRVIFINTGFLDRTGDEIHTSMEAGPVVPKAVMKQQAWINAYEDWNVDVGLKCGLQGKAQIGKGMWPMPDEMLEMYQTKIGHPKSGANCAWVPSPTAATLHAMHYHEILVGDQQTEIMKRPHASLDDILSIPLLSAEDALSEKVIYEELDNNSQGILGYVVRWVDQGVGCSKVPDINNIGLMEDRATCRISSQHIANWLHHGIINEKDVEASMQKMAAVVDKQNAGDPDYRPMAPDFNGHAFNAALSLALEGRIQPSGYTEPILHSQRLTFKGS